MNPETEYHHEIIIPNKKMPVKFFSFSAHDTRRFIPKHWHRSAELLFCTEGRLNVWMVDDTLYELHAGDFLYINSNNIHATQSPEENNVIVLQIPGDSLQIFGDEPSLLIDCNTLTAASSQLEALQHIRDILFQMYSHHAIKETGYNLKIYSLLFELGYTLVRYFRHDSNDVSIQSQKHMDRLALICSYIKEHYKENLALNEVAQRFNYTPQYLARFFKKYTNETFLSYLNDVRLDAAYSALVTTDYSIMQIAEEHGFASAKAFNKIFKETYHTTPNHFRKTYKVKK